MNNPTEKTLLALTQERVELLKKLSSAELDEETIADTLEGDAAEIEAKIIDYGHVIREMTLFVGAIREEEVRIVARRKAQEARITTISQWLLLNMDAAGIKDVPCPLFTVSVKTNPGSVVVDDQSLIPDIFMVVPDLPEPAPDKAAILKQLRDDKEVPGCHLEKSKKIVIK
jgi:hypothetical protein